MANSGFRVFSDTVQKTNELLAEIERVYGWEDRRNQSYAALRAVLWALRDRLPVGQAVHLGAQLPILVRGIYYEGWKPAQVPIKMDRAEFLEHVRAEFPYQIEGGLPELIGTVIKTVGLHIDPGILAKIAQNLPEDIAALLPVRRELVGTEFGEERGERKDKHLPRD